MKIIEPSFKILFMPNEKDILRNLEIYGRTCYKSENKITINSANKFIRHLIQKKHYSVIEHINITVKFICDRGVSHEIVRHRLASYSQESTRYVKYYQNNFKGEITFVRPIFWPKNSILYNEWLKAMSEAETTYFNLIKKGAQIQEARNILPHSLKTEIIMTANLREWRHIINLRANKTAHPQIREIILPLLNELTYRLPSIFEDIYSYYKSDIIKLNLQKETWEII